VEPSTLCCGPIQVRHASKRSENLTSSIGPYTTSANGSPTAADEVASAKRVRKSSWTDSWQITVPSEVHRCPAVPNPPNSAPSTARSRSALAVTTIGFFPPNSRQADWRCRPVSSPIRAPTSLEPVKPTLSIRPASSALSSPSNVVGPSACTTLNTPGGSPPPRQNSSWNAAAATQEDYGSVQTTEVPTHNSG